MTKAVDCGSKCSVILGEMGFTPTSWGETILVAETADKTLAMPLGVRQRGDILWGRLYKSSSLYPIMKQGLIDGVGLCVTQDPILFYKAVFERGNLKPSSINNTPCLEGCSACIASNIIPGKETREYIELILEPQYITLIETVPRVYHRGDAALIEALVHCTRLKYISQGEQRRLAEYIEALVYGVNRGTLDEYRRSIASRILEYSRRILE